MAIFGAKRPGIAMNAKNARLRDQFEPWHICIFLTPLREHRAAISTRERESMATAAKKDAKEIDYVSKEANLTSQIESERQAAKRWWDDYGLCYLENAKSEDFTYDNRIHVLKSKLADPKFQKASLQTTSADYGCRPPFKECHQKKI